jgi:hypothetical protein
MYLSSSTIRSYAFVFTHGLYIYIYIYGAVGLYIFIYAEGSMVFSNILFFISIISKVVQKSEYII